MIERFASKDVYNKMTDDDFDMVVDEFEYILNTTNDDTAEMMEEAVKKITQQVEERYYSLIVRQQKQCQLQKVEIDSKNYILQKGGSLNSESKFIPDLRGLGIFAYLQ